MTKAKGRVSALDIALAALSLCLLIGLMTLFRPCAAHEDGSWMTCHWAGQAALGLSGALTLLGLARLPLSREAKLGADIAFIVFAVLLALIPGRLIGLCMMADMRCRAVTQPAVTVFAALIALASAADILMGIKGR